MKPYRVSVRFYADRENERRTIDYLKKLPEKTINRFIVDAVIEKLQGGDCSLSAGDFLAFREIVREELNSASIIQPAEKKKEAPQQLTEEESAANQESVLSDLDAFFS